MARFIQLVGYLNLTAYVTLAVVAALQWRARRGRPALWAAAAFGALGLALVTARVLPQDGGLLGGHAGRVSVALLLVFPYLLYRFSTAFRPSFPRLDRGLFGMTAVLLAATFALPSFPQAGDPRPWWFQAYLIGFVVHWSVLSIAVAVRLWRAGRGQPSVSRTRMRLLSAAAAALTVAIFVAAFGGPSGSPLRAGASLLGFAGALAFLLALAPPWPVRAFWRRPEEEQLRAAVADLMAATSEAEVAARVLAPAARMLGASAVALHAEDGRLIGTHGLPPDGEERLAREGPEASEGPDGTVQLVRFPGGTFVLWTTPYAPYFGDEELAALGALCGLAGVALDRARLFAQERRTREALEQADGLKTNFVALAAHELRSPVGAVHGIAETLHAHGPALSEGQRAELQELLLLQTRRLALLVDQLLDLSRLEADAISIDPERLRVRERVEEIVAAAAGAPGAVRVDVPAELEADVDPAALDRVVSNLVANAVRHGGAPITVSAEVRDRHFRLTVEDQGPGVSAALVPALFERFTRGSESGTEGTGLGLAIARSYARAHAGDLFYESAEPHGARFRLVIPVGNGDVEAHRLALRR